MKSICCWPAFVSRVNIVVFFCFCCFLFYSRRQSPPSSNWKASEFNLMNIFVSVRFCEFHFLLFFDHSMRCFHWEIVSKFYLYRLKLFFFSFAVCSEGEGRNGSKKNTNCRHSYLWWAIIINTHRTRYAKKKHWLPLNQLNCLYCRPKGLQQRFNFQTLIAQAI